MSEKRQAQLGIRIRAAISSEGLLGIEWLNTPAGERADSDRYIATLKKFILEDKRFNNKTPIRLTFVRDSASIHTSKKTREALDDSDMSCLQLPTLTSTLLNTCGVIQKTRTSNAHLTSSDKKMGHNFSRL